MTCGSGTPNTSRRSATRAGRPALPRGRPQVKADAVDAATLAQRLRGDLAPEAHVVIPEWREARDLAYLASIESNAARNRGESVAA